MKELIGFLILLHLVAYVGASVALQRKTERHMAEPRWVAIETPRWQDLPPAENIEDLRNR